MTITKQIKKPELRKEDLENHHLEGLKFEKIMDRRSSFTSRWCA